MPRQRFANGLHDGVGSEGRQALDAFFAARYAELHRVAAHLKRGSVNVTLNPTALVHEAWLRLGSAPQLAALSAAHFKALAARAMRHVLIDAARRRGAGKRTAEGGQVSIAVDESIVNVVAAEQDVLDLHTALCDLERIAPRQAALVEARYFGGLSVAELAEMLDVSETTVERDWRVAKAWLKTQLRRR
jgi:RNA polymerase sigma factor (TIGR02999 family)